MTPEEFRDEIGLLTGRPVARLGDKEDAAIDEFLKRVVGDEEREIDFSQFNELLLIVNKDRVTKFFFELFFSGTCTIKGISRGVKKFQKTAMLCFGNFIFAYHTLSKIGSAKELESHVGNYCREASRLLTEFKLRRNTILDIEEIPEQRTPLLGYISSGEIRQEHRIAAELSQKLLPQSSNWEDLLLALEAMKERVKKEKKEVAVVNSGVRLVEKFRKVSPEATPTDLQLRIEHESRSINERYKTLEATESEGNRNTDTYLTWDHMDIYFATSMRNSWEYKDLFDFVSKLMKQPITILPEQLQNLDPELKGKSLKELNVRHFDPTQSYDKNRINKGLVEALMLKRAACTVYSVQDTDTLGKDSELAATLAQGKPVIAYAPKIDVEEKTNRLFEQRPADLKFRLQFVLYADERDLKPEDTSYLLSFLSKLEDFESRMLWKAIIDETAIRSFQEVNSEDLRKFCRILAVSEERIYNKREDTLRNVHPLAIQVNLDSGVANGVLVVRDIEDCANLLIRVLTNTMEFDEPEYNPETDCWLLKESLTKSIFRVVTRNQKLTNCFWNFYRQDTQEDRMVIKLNLEIER